MQVKEILVEESNVQPVQGPVTVSASALCGTQETVDPAAPSNWVDGRHWMLAPYITYVSLVNSMHPAAGHLLYNRSEAPQHVGRTAMLQQKPCFCTPCPSPTLQGS